MIGLGRWFARRSYSVIALVAVAALTAAGMWATYSVLDPTPPRTIAMAVGPDGSSSAELGGRYRDLLARDGVTLRLVPTAGDVDHVRLLNDARSGVGAAVVAGGITNDRASPELVSLGTVFYEPLWVFGRAEAPGTTSQSLRGQRLSIGPEGSGSRALSLEFLARVGLIDQRAASMLPDPPEEAAAKLQRGETDFTILLDSWDSPTVQRLLTDENVALSSVRRADAFVALYPFLNKVVLPAGVGDLARNLPPADVLLVAPKASLVVRRDLHPALQSLLLQAAMQIHSGPGVFRKAGEYPAAESVDLPLSDEAVQFYKTGRPFLQRHLPFWLAVLVRQLLVLVIPAFAVLYPMLRLAPALYGWAMRRRVLRLYGELKALEDELAARGGRGEIDDLVRRLERLDDHASGFRSPMTFRPLLYGLREHISLVRERLGRRAAD